MFGLRQAESRTRNGFAPAGYVVFFVSASSSSLLSSWRKQPRYGRNRIFVKSVIGLSQIKSFHTREKVHMQLLLPH